MSNIPGEASENELDPHKQNQSARPLPNDFMNYYPWACGQFQAGVNIIINKIVQTEHYGTGVVVEGYQQTKKIRALRNPLKSQTFMKIESMKYNKVAFSADPIVRINAICNLSDRLVHLKFEKAEIPLPRLLVVILNLIVKFHTHLISISFKRNITKFIIYEVSKLVEHSTITEVYLDNCYVKDGNYVQLLNEKCELKVISLAGCVLTDSIVSAIAEKLHYLKEGSKYLNVLNLSSNKITDVGAKSLAESLRSNRTLCHLNLSGNFITDGGAFAILDTMLEFSISIDEKIAARGRRYKYLADKVELVRNLILKLTDEYVEARKRKILKVQSSLLKKRLSTNFYQIPDDDRERIHDRANYLAESTLGAYIDPFYPLTTENGTTYCFGNNYLHSLNLAYNNLSILSVRRVLKVMTYQSILNRKPKGLININIEGNYLPLKCKEYSEIDSLMAGIVHGQNKTKRGRSQYN